MPGGSSGPQGVAGTGTAASSASVGASMRALWAVSLASEALTMSPGSLADLVLTVHQGRMYDRYRENAGPLWLHAPIGLDICASVGLRHTRGRPPRGPRPAFVLRRNLTAARQETGFARKVSITLAIA